MTPQAPTDERCNAAVRPGSDRNERCSDGAAVFAAELLERRSAVEQASFGDAEDAIARRPTPAGERVGRR